MEVKEEVEEKIAFQSNLKNIDKTDKRNYVVDVIRIIACLIVIGNHCCLQAFNEYYSQVDWSRLFEKCFLTDGVPMFFMITGFFIVNGRNYKKIWKSTLIRVLLPTFIYDSIDHSSCPSNGILTISGRITEKLEDIKKINIPLTYPEGITLTCEFNDAQDKVECKVDREINNKTIIIEQTVIKNGNEDYFNLKSISCSNALLQ